MEIDFGLFICLIYQTFKLQYQFKIEYALFFYEF